MENLIIKFIENIHYVFIVVVILCFIIPIIYTIIRRKQRKKKRYILDKRTILIDSGVSSNIRLILFYLVFLVFGLIIIYAAINTAGNLSTMIFGIIVGLVMCLIPIILSLKTIRTAKKILNAKYIIILDELKDKYYYQDNSSGADHSRWKLYFKDYFKTYNKYVGFKDLKEGDNYKIGDKFYLVFLEGSNYPYMFPANEYNLAPSEKEKLKTIDEAAEYIKLEKFVLETETPSETIVINKERIINDFCESKSIIPDILIPIGMLLLGIIEYICFSQLLPLIIMLMLFLFFLVMGIYSIKYRLNIINNIKKNNYKIKEDEVVSLNNRIRYSDSNEMISFKFKNYKKIVYAEKKYFTDIAIGDKLYLVFVKGKKEPIRVYNAKHSTIEVD